MKNIILILGILLLLTSCGNSELTSCEISGTIAYDVPAGSTADIKNLSFPINDNSFCITKAEISDQEKLLGSDFISYKDLRKTHQEITIFNENIKVIGSGIIFPKEDEIEITTKTTAANLVSIMYETKNTGEMQERYNAIIESTEVEEIAKELENIIKNDKYITFLEQLPEIIK